MELYNHVDALQLEEMAIACGRAAHIVRSCTQGYLGLNFPEAATCDQLCAQLEQHARGVCAHIRERKDAKALLMGLGRTAVFLCRVASPDFMSQETVQALGEKQITLLRDLLEGVRDIAKFIDMEINRAILKLSAGLFGGPYSDPLPSISQPPALQLIASLFDPSLDSYVKYTTLKLSLPEIKEAMTTVGAHISNKAHEMQEAVTRHLLDPRCGKEVGTVINTAGGLENEGRALVGLFAQPQVPHNWSTVMEKHLTKLGEVSGNVVTAAGNTKIPPQAVETVRRCLDEEARLVEIGRVILVNYHS